MTAFCVKINNHLNSFYKWHCAINMDAVTNICIKVVPPSSDSTLIHISGFSVIPHFPLHAIHKKGFSTPLRSQAHYGGYGFATLTTSPYLRTFLRVSMVLKRVLTWYHASYLRVWQSALPCCVLSTSSHFKMIAFR